MGQTTCCQGMISKSAKMIQVLTVHHPQPQAPATSLLLALVLLQAPKKHVDHTDVDVGPKEGRKTPSEEGAGEKPGLFLSKAVYSLICCGAHVLPVHDELSPQACPFLYCPRTQPCWQLDSTAALNTHISF